MLAAVGDRRNRSAIASSVLSFFKDIALKKKKKDREATGICVIVTVIIVRPTNRGYSKHSKEDVGERELFIMRPVKVSSVELYQSQLDDAFNFEHFEGHTLGFGYWEDGKVTKADVKIQ